MQIAWVRVGAGLFRLRAKQVGGQDVGWGARVGMGLGAGVGVGAGVVQVAGPSR